MVFPIAGGNESKGYEISNSLRFNPGDSPRLTRTTGTATNETKFTYSTWIKQNVASSGQFAWLTSGSLNAGTDCFLLNFNDQKFQFVTTGAADSNVISNAVFRDESAWYHFVVEVDTTQGTASNRMKFYVNGTQLTSFGTASYPSQDYTFTVSSQTAVLGAYDAGGYAGHFDGYMAETHYIDGTAYDADNFGETNDNGVWIPKKFTGSYGNNGFFLEFKQTGTSQNSSGIGADTSGNDNHFAVTNITATDITEDTPTNNFATMNPLESDRQQGGAATFAEGNLQITTSYVDANYQRYPQVYSTQAVSSGKWYFEMKITTSDTDSFIGVHSPDNYASDGTTNPYGGYASTGAIYTSRGAVRINDGQTTGHGTFSQNDIVGCALDIDNNKVYFHKNGTYVQSGDPAGNSGGQAIPSGYTYGFTVGNDTASDSGTMQVNFGNPVHTISSGNTDGKYGNFEYAVPSGFYAVCTKRLAEFG